MKIGTLTFHAAHNNGAMLQSLALQTILKRRYKVDTEIIDFSNEEQRDMYSPFQKSSNVRRFIKNCILLMNYRKCNRQFVMYHSFKDKYLDVSKKKYYSIEELEQVSFDYDAVIVGSDQIWNTKCRDADDAYYLPFKIKNKYSYAVSFAGTNPFLISKEKYIKYIKDFNKVSVREKNGQKWIKENINMDVPICLDPTMLLSQEEWDNLIDNKNPIIDTKYIFYYCFSIDNETQKFLKKTSKKYNMPVYFMDPKEWTLKCCWRNGIKLVNVYGPDVYLNLVKHASLFITTSFHGIAFAIIYKKQFWYIDSGKNDLTKDDRAVSFLSRMGLMDRYKTINELNILDLQTTPNYYQSFINLEKLKKESFEYLDSIIDDINE